MRLLSDFRDYYDHAFDGWWKEGAVILDRDTRTSRTRAVDHATLEEAGFHVPANGPLHAFRPDNYVVAYTDQYAHRGEGKERGTAAELLQRLPGSTHACLWVGPREGGRSTRLLAIGSSWFELLYSSADWRSNVDGDVSGPRQLGRIHVPRALLNLQKLLHHPLIAVDLVQGWALDLNTAPGLKGTGIEALLTPTQVHELLASWAPV